MEIQLILNGKTRKEAATCVGEVLEIAPVYQRAPTYAYTIGKVEIDRQGILHIDERDKHLPAILNALRAQEFLSAETKPDKKVDKLTSPTTLQQPDHLTIQIPKADFTDISLDNLSKLVASKATLLQKAIGTDNLQITQDGQTLNFPWFSVNATPEEATAYTQLVAALCDMAKKQQRILATDKPVDNEKYAFRCFLLRLGFIGEEYATSRRILLQNLSGNGSFKSGERKSQIANAEPERQPDNADDVSEADGAEVTQGINELTEASTAAHKSRFSLKKLFSGLKIMALN